MIDNGEGEKGEMRRSHPCGLDLLSSAPEGPTRWRTSDSSLFLAGKKSSRSFYSEGDDGDLHVGPVFQATFGNRCYTWSFRPWHEFRPRNPSPGFEWRGGPGSTEKDRIWESSSESDDDPGWANRRRAWERDSDFDDDDDDDDDDRCRASTPVGLYSHRVTLGLPATGPLKIGDVKIA